MKLQKSSLTRRALSPLIATLILIAITIVGGVVVYRAFFATAGTVNSNLHAAIQDVSLSTSGGLSLTVKNDGTTAIDFANAHSVVVTGPGTPGCGLWAPTTPTLAPGATQAVQITCSTDSTLLIPGDTYLVTLTVSGPGTTGSVVTTSSVIAIA